MHRYLAYAVILPLAMTTITGLLYKVLLEVFGVQKEKIKFLLKLHQMSILFPNSAVIYTTLLATLVTALTIFGYTMIYNPLWKFRSGRNNRFAPRSMREYHHRYSSVLFIVLLFMSLTGGVYRFCRAALGVGKEDIHWLLELHHMGFLPTWLSVIWVIFTFACIFSLIVSGGRILPVINNLFRPSKYQVLASSTATPPTPSANTTSDVSIIVSNINQRDINEIDAAEETLLINNNDDSYMNVTMPSPSSSSSYSQHQQYNSSSSSSLSPRDGNDQNLQNLKDSF